MKPRLISGIQPSGRLHLGNYLGALKNFVELQNSDKYECYFFIADLHSITEDFDPKNKHQQILELVADYLAAGLDPKKSVLFQQSQIPAHSELAWILNTVTPMGELRRMTQYKEKSGGEKETSNVGLFTYPTLMAADIVLYDAHFVPVGEDQLQHLELTRTISRKFNSKFGEILIEPKPVLTETPRVMSLGDPSKKMSKSKPETCLFLDDSPEEIRAKFKKAVTDSESEIKYDPDKKPAVSNLLKIFSSITDQTTDKLEKEFVGKTYVDFKNALAEAVVERFEKFRSVKKSLLAEPKSLEQTLSQGSQVAGQFAEQKILSIKKKVGLLVN